MDVYGVIIAGGVGERLWPLSTQKRPKQFLSLFGGRPLIAHAVDRLRGFIPAEKVLVITGAALVGQTRRALPGLAKENVYGEPCRRNTAAAVALAVREVKRRGGDKAVCCVLTADQLISPAAKFRATLRKAATLAVKGTSIVTLGIVPKYAATGFGYIDVGTRKFTEKPDAKTAAKYLKGGRHLWNSGMFIFRVDKMERSFREFAPGVAPVLDAKNWKRLYPSLEKISVDYAVMEKTPDIAVVPADFDWDDVGSFRALHSRLPQDARGNAVVASVPPVLDNVRNSLIVDDTGRELRLRDLDGMAVIVTKAGTVLRPLEDR